jgi:amino acid adenylation domain-containing protein
MVVPPEKKGFHETQQPNVSLTDTEKQLLRYFNATSAIYESDKTILTLFKEQVSANPNHVAVIHNEVQLTYRELDERSNQLAHLLKDMGVERETCVIICVQRSVQMIIGILGILKAGGAYVPIDPDYPESRIRYTVEDISASIIITDSESKIKLPTGDNLMILNIDHAAVAQQSSYELTVEIKPNDLAYIIYTSGSTGMPKGVMIEHRSTCSFIRWCQQEFSFSHFDVVYAVTSICFDLSVFEIFYPLCSGKKIRLLESGLDIENYLRTDKNVLINTVPSMVDSLLKQNIDLTNVTVINMAGEAVPLHVLKKLDTNRIETRNLYGPTEDTTYSTVFRLKKDHPILIGKPISNTTIYILDTHKRLVPIGIEGEIYIAGDGLSRGYLNKEELTNEKFLKNPFEENPNARMYKTGDLGRWRADGNIEYLGRIDDQVKIRGYRIELAEIEQTLEKNDLIQQAVVTGNEDETGNKRLIAYLIAKTDFNKEEIIDYLKKKLPEYMIPGLFIKMEKMPLTENGKIDRKRLPKPFEQRLLETTYETPRNKIENRLVIIWQALLRIKRIGIQDNFFELGGNSILSTQVVSRARNFYYLLQPVDLYLYPTIAELAKVVSDRSKKKEKGLNMASIVPFQTQGAAPPLFLIPGFWLYRKLALYLSKHRPFYGFEPYNFKSIEHVASHFVSELKTEQPKGPYFIGAFCEHYPVAFAMARQLMEQGEEVPLLILIEAYASTATLSMKSSRFIKRKLRFYAKEMKKMSLTQKFKFIRREIRNAFIILYSKLKPEQKTVKAQNYPGNVALFRSSIVAPSFNGDPQMGWQEYVTGNIESITIEGDHFGILDEPAVAILANQLNDIITKYSR